MHMCSGSSLTKIEELLVVAKLDLRSLAFEMLHKIVDWPFPVFCPIGPIIRRIHGLSSGLFELRTISSASALHIR